MLRHHPGVQAANRTEMCLGIALPMNMLDELDGHTPARIWRWVCDSPGCGSTNLKELSRASKSGELLRVECRECGTPQSQKINPAALIFDRRKQPRG